MSEKRELILEKTKKGFPALWENGGGYTNTGDAVIIAGKQGERLCPVYVNRRGHLANGAHALFIVKVGYYFIEAEHHRQDFSIHIWRIEEIHSMPHYEEVWRCRNCGFEAPEPQFDGHCCPKCLQQEGNNNFRDIERVSDKEVCTGEDFAGTAVLVHSFSRGEWDTTPPPELSAAIEAAKEKALCYHCREPHYAAS